MGCGEKLVNLEELSDVRCARRGDCVLVVRIMPMVEVDWVCVVGGRGPFEAVQRCWDDRRVGHCAFVETCVVERLLLIT